MRTLTSTAALVFALALGAIGAVAPRVAVATPSKDACNGMLEWNPQFSSIDVFAPGTWCLDHDIVISQDESVFSLILLHANDITIDCRGHLLEYQGNADFSYGVAAAADGLERQTVRNCRFRGFSTSVTLGSGDGGVIEDNIVHSSRAGALGSSSAIDAFGTVTIRRNRLFDSVGRAIAVGPGSVVADNLVDGVVGAPFDDYVVGIDTYGDGVDIVGNTLRGLRHASAGNGILVQAIQLSGDDTGGRINIADNVFVNTDAIESTAINCASDDARKVDNVITGFTYPTVGCADAGDNDVTP